jgi:hypothetical protein
MILPKVSKAQTNIIFCEVCKIRGSIESLTGNSMGLNISSRLNNEFDVAALMKLARPAPLSKLVRTICLPESGEQPRAGLQCVTSGWGRSGPSPALSTALLEANVPLLELAQCLKAYGKSVPIREGHLCAGNTDGSSGSCVVSSHAFIML